MHPRARAFRDRVRDTFDIDVEVYELADGTKSAKDAADAVGCDLSQISKSMVMAVDGDLVLVLTSGPNRVDESALADQFGVDQATVAPADPAQIKVTLGWSIGGLPPFVHDTKIPTIIDPDLLDHDEVWSGAGTPNAVFPIGPETLSDLTDAKVADVVLRA